MMEAIASILHALSYSLTLIEIYTCCELPSRKIHQKPHRWIWSQILSYLSPQLKIFPVRAFIAALLMKSSGFLTYINWANICFKLKFGMKFLHSSRKIYVQKFNVSNYTLPSSDIFCFLNTLYRKFLLLPYLHVSFKHNIWGWFCKSIDHCIPFSFLLKYQNITWAINQT